MHTKTEDLKGVKTILKPFLPSLLHSSLTCSLNWLFCLWLKIHSTFAGKHLDNLSDTLLDQYDKLINQPSNDWEIYYWMTEKKPTPEEYNNEVMDMLKIHAKNKKMEERIRQPDLQEKWAMRNFVDILPKSHWFCLWFQSQTVNY